MTSKETLKLKWDIWGHCLNILLLLFLQAAVNMKMTYIKNIHKLFKCIGENTNQNMKDLLHI